MIYLIHYAYFHGLSDRCYESFHDHGHIKTLFYQKGPFRPYLGGF
jgi:hypothetical protein